MCNQIEDHLAYNKLEVLILQIRQILGNAMGLLGHKQHWMGISKLIGIPKCALKIKEKERLIVKASREPVWLKPLTEIEICIPLFLMHCITYEL